MSLKRFFSAALSAALLIGTCACAPEEAVESSAPPVIGEVVVQTSPVSGPTDYPPEETVPFTPGPEYNEDHRLTAEIPPLIDGLEMPVIGATGYTTVTLPLYASNPNETPEPDPTEEPSAPEPTPSAPEETVPPAPPPEETVEPATEPPAETETPTDPETWPSQFVDLPEDPSEEPAPLSEQGTFVEPVPPTEPPPQTEPPSTPEPTAAPEPEPTEPPDPYADAAAVWDPGTAFVILREDGDWWYVSRRGEYGWIEHRYCMINLPDVIPSMIYNDANAYASIFTAIRGKRIPGITGEQLYDSLTFNDRLDKQEFVMPILYSAARNICKAQHKALAEGNCLVVYQTFRPYQAQIDVANAMKALAKTDPEVNAGITTRPWSIDWFIATGVSNHQRGYALDATMVKVYATETKYVGSYPYLRVTDYEDYRMPTAMHELSYEAASTTGPNSSKRSETMNEPAIALQNYFTSSGLSLLPSEWWHFNDNNAMRATADKPSDGRYFTSECLSCPPEWVSGLLND